MTQKRRKSAPSNRVGVATYVCDIPGVSAGGGVESQSEGFFAARRERRAPSAGRFGEYVFSKNFSKDFKVT